MRVLTVRSIMTKSGPGTQPFAIARHFASLGHKTTFVTSGGEMVDEIRKAGFKVELVPGLAPHMHQPLNILKAVLSLAKIIKRENPDVLHCHNAAATACSFVASRLVLKKIPCVTSVRGVEERKTRQWRNKIWKYLPGMLLPVCNNAQDRLTSFGVSKKKISVIYNGVDIKRFDPHSISREKIRKDLGFENKLVIGVTGAMLRHDSVKGATKGQQILIKALALLKKDFPNLHVLLVGDGSARKDVEDIVKINDLDNEVTFAGRRFDIPEMLSAMDIYCQPSVFGEFFPNAIVEAMAMGKPWVGSDIAGLSELTVNDRAGWVSPPGDVMKLADNIAKLIRDPKLREKRGLVGMQYVHSELTISKVGERILRSYELADK